MLENRKHFITLHHNNKHTKLITMETNYQPNEVLTFKVRTIEPKSAKKIVEHLLNEGLPFSHNNGVLSFDMTYHAYLRDIATNPKLNKIKIEIGRRYFK